MPHNMLKKNELARKILAGIFLIGGIWLITTVILTIGKNKGLTEPKFQVKVLYKDVGGLIEGAPVRLAGVNVGYVSTIGFLDEEIKGRRVLVVLNVFDKYKKQLKQAAVFAIKTEGILGEKLIEISILEQGPPLDLQKSVIGLDPIDVQDMAEVFADAAESFTNTTDAFNQIDVEKLSQGLSDAAESLSVTSQGINEILKELQYVTTKFKRLLNRVEKKLIDGDLFKVF